MASIQCKMCGGSVELPDGVTTGECPYCGSVTTFPRINSEQKEHLYTRAEHFRQANNFDKAVVSYEALLNLDAEDPEAYWGLLISRYGIEYVEDPATHERVPTCHRVQFDSILADSDYLNALKFSSGYDHEIYEKEAQRISEIQKSILRISAQEKPYDVFICYKEATDAGTRTKDSTLAQDIYYQLTNQGLKVFFSRITLEDKLGQQYEPYIFAALNSAKVMLVIGSKREYFEAVWVKNEWSRFLALMKNDRSKLLIPCYKDMDPYDIPEELSLFQSQDMGKIGFIQDILRGVLKVVNSSKNEAKPAVDASSSREYAGITKLMKRISILMEQQDWDKAKEICDTGLNLDPENPELYLTMCMINHRITNEDALLKTALDLDVDKNFRIAIKLAQPERRKQLEMIQQEDRVLFFLKKYMDSNQISSPTLIPQCREPLISDENFQFAMKSASPERQIELKKLQEDQVDFFLRKCMEFNHVSTESDLTHNEMPLINDVDFQTAILCATPEKQNELKNLQEKQVEFFLRKCMENNQVSTESDLAHCEALLVNDTDLQTALLCATPARREQLQQIIGAQSNHFLQNCIKKYHDLMKCPIFLIDDPDFHMAQICAFADQKKKLDLIASQQYKQLKGIMSKRKLYIIGGATILALLMLILYMVGCPGINGYIVYFVDVPLIFLVPNLSRLLAIFGNVEAQYELAQKYEFGIGGMKDLTAAGNLYRKAAERGHTGAKVAFRRFFDTINLSAKTDGKIRVPIPCGESLTLVKVEAGPFVMSAEDGENKKGEDVHQAQLTRDYYIGQTEVTQSQWNAIMGCYYYIAPERNGYPVSNVSWIDAMQFCETLNELEIVPKGWHFCLPTETQWEFAARGGKKSRGFRYSGSNIIDEVAWYSNNSGKSIHPVGQKKSNELGLYDMSGNVWEWCLDDWQDHSNKLKSEFIRDKTNGESIRPQRGGSYKCSALDCRLANREKSSSFSHHENFGFRVVLVPISYAQII